MVDSSSRTRTREPIFEQLRSEPDTQGFPSVGGPPPVSPVAKAPERTKRAKEYESKTNDLFRTLMKATAASEGTVSDAAAIIVHGPTVASKVGDLADVDPRVRRAVDFIMSGTENPYAALVAAAIPFVAQIVRNHEMETTVHPVVKVPFLKRTFRFPFRLRLRNKVLRSFTHKPQDLTKSVFEDDSIRMALLTQRVEVAYPGYTMESEATGE